MPMNIPVVPAILFGTAVFFIVMANIVFYSMLGEVNGKRPQNEQISMLFVNIKLFEVIRIHKQLFPASRKPTMMFALAGIGIACGFSVMFTGSL
jgi:hypothetical protein